VYLASLPFRHLLVIERNGFLLLMVLLAIWSACHRRVFVPQTPLNVAVLAFVGWVALTIPFAQFPAYSLKEFGKLLQDVLIFYAVLYFLGDEADRRRLVSLMVGTTGLVSLYGLAQFNPSNQQAMTSFLPSEVWLTTYLVLFVPLCFGASLGQERPWVRRLGIGIGVSAVVCLVLTRSRAGSLALLVELAMMAWLFRRRRRVVLGMISALVLVSGLWLLSVAGPRNGIEPIPMNKNVGSIVHRFDIWTFSLLELPKHPIVGIGYGKDNYLLVYGDQPEDVEPGHVPVRKAGVHNIFLYYALHVGIPGALLFVWLAIRTIHTLWLGVKSSSDQYAEGVCAAVLVGVAGALVRFQFDFMLVGTLAVLFWTILAIGVAHLSDGQRREFLSHQ
jgi:O-antigen ligase